jgi:hypothetical protein
MSPAPIVLFVYKRPGHTRKTVESLLGNPLAKESELFIFSDGPRDAAAGPAVFELRQYIRTISGFKKVTITERAHNLGLARNIIDGVTSVVGRFGSAIVLEDDMVLSPWFLDFMNDGLSKYRDEEKVISIHGYSYSIPYPEPVYFLRGADCWGWATWKRGWDLFNPDSRFLLGEIRRLGLSYTFNMDDTYDYIEMLKAQEDGRIDSWAVRWYASALINDKLTLYACPSLLNNIGHDGSETHGQDPDLTNTIITDKRIVLKDIPVAETPQARKLVCRHLYRRMGVKAKLKRWVKGGLQK